MAAPVASHPVSYAAYLIGDGGLPILAGPAFSTLADARAWCAARKSTDEWKVLEMTVVDDPEPRPVRAFLLPVQGEPQEFWIPPGIGEAHIATNNAIGGVCVQWGMGRKWSGRRGTYALLVSHRAGSRVPANAVLGDFLIGPESIDERVRGPVILVRNRAGEPLGDKDDVDPDSYYLSIPADIKPSEWKTLLETEDKSAME